MNKLQPFASLPLNQVLPGDCLEVLAALPDKSVDLIFADPPYNLQLRNELWRPNLTRVDAVDDAWDQFDSFAAYDRFSRQWLSECQRVLKDSGSLWVIGTYHNIFRLGALLQDLGYWILNDIVWIKTNPMPQFRGVRFTNAHETLIWAVKDRKSRTRFNYHAMKFLNDGKQMRSDWTLPICLGAERLRADGRKLHSTQKPEALLYRVLLAASQPGDVVLDPFFGTGTTGAVAKKLHRNWIGIENIPEYVELARQRIAGVTAEPYDPQVFDVSDPRRNQPRLAFTQLLEIGMICPGQELYFSGDLKCSARVKPDGNLVWNGSVGSIHEMGRALLNGRPCNGWDYWFFRTAEGELRPLDELRQAARRLGK